jgi:hypothetical protein
VVVALIPATWFTAQRVFDTSAAPSGASTDLPIPPVSPRTSGTPTANPTATSAPTSAPTVARLPRVSPDAPRRIVSGGVIDSGFDNAVSGVEAASDTEVARLESRGSPGSPGTDTVYVIGRVRTGADSAFADLPELAVGSTVSIRTDSGTMTYTVTATTPKAESALAQDPLFTERVAGRLVLVGIRYAASGDRLRDALVVTAQLSGAEKG